MKKTIELLRENDNFLIITHKKPDGDTTGTASALCQVLRELGKTAYIAENTDITPRYAHLIVPYYAPKDYKEDFVITTDVASIDLLTEDSKKYIDNIDLCIDHHFLSNKGIAKHNLILDYSACSEIIYEIMLKLDVKITAGIAEAIYIAIATDTGCFKYSNTNENTHIVASKCIGLIKAGEINRELFEIKTKERIAIEKRVLNNLTFYFDHNVVVASITKKDKEETGASADDLDSISALPRSIDGVCVGITIFEQNNGDMKISIRSNGDISASEICETYGGGGHLRAAGCTFKNVTLKEATEKIIEATKKVGKYV